MSCLIGKFKDLNKAINNFNNINLKKHNINVLPHHIPIFYTINVNGVITFNELQKELELSKSTLSDTITRYEKMGYIYKNEKSQDKRCINIELTKSGVEVMKKLEKIDNEFREKFFHEIEENDRKHLEQLIDLVINNLENA